METAQQLPMEPRGRVILWRRRSPKGHALEGFDSVEIHRIADVVILLP